MKEEKISREKMEEISKIDLNLEVATMVYTLIKLMDRKKIILIKEFDDALSMEQDRLRKLGEKLNKKVIILPKDLMVPKVVKERVDYIQ